MMKKSLAPGETDSAAAQVDVVVVAKKFLENNRSSCPLGGHVVKTRPQGGGTEHECGSVRCVSAFLGDKNWGRTKETA